MNLHTIIVHVVFRLLWDDFVLSVMSHLMCASDACVILGLRSVKTRPLECLKLYIMRANERWFSFFCVCVCVWASILMLRNLGCKMDVWVPWGLRKRQKFRVCSSRSLRERNTTHKSQLKCFSGHFLDMMHWLRTHTRVCVCVFEQ